MKRSNYILILLFTVAIMKGQNWAQVDTNFKSPVTSLYYSAAKNKLYIAGSFQMNIGNKNFQGIASYDGVKFDTLGGGFNFSTAIIFPLEMIEYKSDLYVAGQFNDMKTLHSKGIAKWNGVKWDSLGDQLNGVACAMEKYNNDLYVGGYFWKVGNQNIRSVAKYDGSNWSIIGSGFPYNFTNTLGTINCMTVYNNELYVGGHLTDSSGNSLCVAKWNGTKWSTGSLRLFGGTVEVNDMVVYNGCLYVCGRFYESDGCLGNNIVKFDGVKWSRLGDGITTLGGLAKKMRVYNNKLYVVGGFYDVQNNIPAHSIAIWNDTVWCAPPTGTQQYLIYDVEQFNDSIYIGGGFTWIGNDTVPALAKLTTTVTTCSNPVGIKEYSQYNSSFSVYPNPVSNILYIEIFQSDFENSKIEIINTLGETVLKQPFANTVDLSQLPPAIYYLRINGTADQIYTRKVIKQ